MNSHLPPPRHEQPLPPVDQARELLARMLLIRAFEEQLRSLFAAGMVPGLVHLSSGQEAVAVGVCAALRPTDWIASTHRGHGHCLAKGADAKRLMAEIMGRRAGYGLGRGGSMHVFDAAHANLGTNGIVGGGIPLATGAGLSAKRRGRGEVAVCFFGDGALNQGLLTEVMNMAAIWRLPVLFVCESNGYGEFTATGDVTAGSDPLARGRVFDIPSEAVDGMDVLAVLAATERAVARGRAGGGPTFLVCMTYRYGGHHAGDRQDYKNPEEAKAWLARDPIPRLAARLEAEGVADAAALADIEAAAAAEARAAVAFAKAQPFPALQDLASHLHG